MLFSQCIVNRFIQVSQMLRSDSALSECGLFAPVPFGMSWKGLWIFYSVPYMCALSAAVEDTVLHEFDTMEVCVTCMYLMAKLGIFSVCLHRHLIVPSFKSPWNYPGTRRFSCDYCKVGFCWGLMIAKALILLDYSFIIWIIFTLC